MEDAARSQPDQTAWRWVVRALAVTAKVLGYTTAAVTIGVAARLAMQSYPKAAQWGPAVAVALAALVAMLAGAVHRRRVWVRPRDQIVDLLPKIQSGQAPIEQLSDIGGAMTPVVKVIQDLARDLRLQQAEINTLHHEMSLRVARRTDALERTLSTLKQQAVRDPLTGLFNRRMLDDSLPKLLEQAREAGTNVCLLMADLDHFKHLNDTRGHAAGDEFLRAAGQIMRSTIREHDLAFRCGGDEFVIVLPDISSAGVRAILVRLTGLIDALAKTYHVQPAPRMSIGISHASNFADPSPELMLEAADRALYTQKHSRSRKARAG